MPQPDFLALVVLGLAAWRITKLAMWERGPFIIFHRLREVLGIEHDQDGEPCSYPARGPGLVLGCFRCTSLWVAMGLVGLYLAFPQPTLAAAFPLALSAVAISLEEVLNGQSQH